MRSTVRAIWLLVPDPFSEQLEPRRKRRSVISSRGSHSEGLKTVMESKTNDVAYCRLTLFDAQTSAKKSFPLQEPETTRQIKRM